jgi:hypothetical protein
MQCSYSHSAYPVFGIVSDPHVLKCTGGCAGHTESRSAMGDLEPNLQGRQGSIRFVCLFCLFVPVFLKDRVLHCWLALNSQAQAIILPQSLE